MSGKMFTVPSGAEVELDENNYIETEVVFDASALIDHDLEGFLDLLSLGATDTELLTDISYRVDRVDSFGNLVIIVTGDMSMVLESEGEDE